MKLFVTGLCLQGNKGGPALVFSLLKALRSHWSDVEFVLSVPSGDEFRYEQSAAKKYDMEIVERATAWDLLRPTPAALKRFFRWLGALRSCDSVLEMSAISYVGPPAGNGSFKAVFLGYRFFYFAICRIFRKPMLAWTQSYGPFSTKSLRVAGGMDLRRQPTVLCRGDDCAKEVERLLPGKSTRSFPDVAVVLDCHRNGAVLPDSKRPKQLVTISPSAVVYSKNEGEGAENGHVKLTSDLVDHLVGLGFEVLLVPHTFRPDRHVPSNCDYAVCQLVAERSTSEVSIVEEDLSPQNLKGIISGAFIHIGARYHSIVAALSTGVPCISLSWHPKYLDIMRFYGLGDFVFDSVSATDNAQLCQMIDTICSKREALSNVMSERHVNAVKAVEENVQVFVENHAKMVK